MSCHRVGETGSKLGPDLSDVGKQSVYVLKDSGTAIDASTWRSAQMAQRRSEGIEVSLIWISPVESLSVVVLDERSGNGFELVVQNGTVTRIKVNQKRPRTS